MHVSLSGLVIYIDLITPIRFLIFHKQVNQIMTTSEQYWDLTNHNNKYHHLTYFTEETTMVTKFLFFCFICFISFKSIAQHKDEIYEFESIVYTPTQEILRIMDEDMIACFNGLDIIL